MIAILSCPVFRSVPLFADTSFSLASAADRAVTRETRKEHTTNSSKYHMSTALCAAGYSKNGAPEFRPMTDSTPARA